MSSTHNLYFVLAIFKCNRYLTRSFWSPGQSFKRRGVMRKSLWIVLALLVVGVGQLAHADTTESFNFSGTTLFSDSGDTNKSVTGTFTIDFTKGIITAFDFNALGLLSGFHESDSVASILTFTPAANPNTDFVDLHFLDTTADTLDLWFQTDLASFAGNTFFTSSIGLPGGGTGESELVINLLLSTPFASGSATPVTAPEPASLLLLGSGLLGLAGIKRRRSGF